MSHGIQPEGRCELCNATFKWDEKRRYYCCPEHLTSPQRYTVYFSYKGKRYTRGTTLDGQTLRSHYDAQALLERALDEIGSKTFDPERWRAKSKYEYHFDMLIDKWYQEKHTLMEQGKRAPSYVPKLNTYVRHYYLPFFNKTDVREVRSLKDFANTLPARLSLKYQKNLTDALKGFFLWCKEERLIEEIPVVPKIEVPEHECKTVTGEVQDAVLNYISTAHTPIFTFLFRQGCRPSEARALKWDCIDGDVVTYKRTFSGRVLREHTKTKKIRSNILFSETLKALPPRGLPMDFVFKNPETQSYYSDDVLHRIFRKAVITFNEETGSCLSIGLYQFTKHSFGTQMVNEGVDRHTLKEWYGHKDLRSTDRYLKPDMINLFRAKLGKVVEMRRASEASSES